MSVAVPEYERLVPNPIEVAEEIMMVREWPFDRPLDDELVAEISGNWCNFRLWLSWEESMRALVLTSAYDMKIPAHRRQHIYPLLAQINEQVLLGHFDLNSEDGSICFRYGQLLKGARMLSTELIEELLDIAYCECERFYPAFQSVLWGNRESREALQLAMLEPVGQA